MNVYHPIVPSFDETPLEHPHEPGQANKLDPFIPQQRFGLRPKGGPIKMPNDAAPNSGLGRESKTRRLGMTTDNEDNLRGIGRIAARIDQRLQVRATA